QNQETGHVHWRRAGRYDDKDWTVEAIRIYEEQFNLGALITLNVMRFRLTLQPLAKDSVPGSGSAGPPP
ncbi:MAG: hypothetical protein ACO3ZG_09725, partial [Kiritimatiellia bacterium]